MIDKRLARWLFGSTFVTALLLPAIALAEEITPEAAAQAEAMKDWRYWGVRAASAGLAMGLSALAAGYAQAKIGSAGAGTLAERPEVSIWIITLQALPEVIVLLGFVSAILISG
jgi:V/A-type H+/Na+-transporting ATPase subunit K